MHMAVWGPEHQREIRSWSGAQAAPAKTPSPFALSSPVGAGALPLGNAYLGPLFLIEVELGDP